MAMLQDDITVSDAVLSDANTRDKFDVKIEPVDKKDLPNTAAKKGVRYHADREARNAGRTIR